MTPVPSGTTSAFTVSIRRKKKRSAIPKIARMTRKVTVPGRLRIRSGSVRRLKRFIEVGRRQKAVGSLCHRKSDSILGSISDDRAKFLRTLHHATQHTSDLFVPREETGMISGRDVLTIMCKIQPYLGLRCFTVRVGELIQKHLRILPLPISLGDVHCDATR